MSAEASGQSGGNLKHSTAKEKVLKSNKAGDLERIRQSLAKRSLNVKFDLHGSCYKPVENIGIGAYGVVCSAIHSKTGDKVAIKKIPSVFEALIIAKRTYREIKILKHFKHDNIICIREILMPKEDVKDFKDIYVVFDLMESDLHRIIYSKQDLSDEHIRYFLYQILRGLKYIHSANVIHRDLKPSNLLVNEDCHLRIGDFGMARGVFYTPDEPSYYMTQYVATRWYRAPEILLSMLEYGTAVDMWSVGCIFAEMIGRKHLFPGKDHMSQVKLILGVLGTPSEAVLKNCQNEILKRIIKSFGKKEPLAWDKLFPKASKKSVDLLSKMLVVNPSDRITVNKALSHRLLNNYHDPDDEPVCVPPFNFDFEKEDLDKALLRDVIMKEIQDFHHSKPPSLSFSALLRPVPKSEDKQTVFSPFNRGHSAQDQFSGTEGHKTDFDNKLGEVSKPPLAAENSKASSKISSVSVDIQGLLAAPSVDIEMLSAQSHDGKAMDIHTLDPAEPSQEEQKKPVEKEDTKQAPQSVKKIMNTISEDTKALVKQALMNATQRRQRAESQGDDGDKLRPVTAAQRQKEREEKRRKKKERANNKIKKTKEKKGVQDQIVSLSNQDMELLRRWTVMQNPAQKGQQSSSNSNSPPHPQPSLSPPQPTGASGSFGSQSSLAGSVSSIKPSGSISTSTAVNKLRQILAKTTAVTIGTSISLNSSQMTSGGTVLIPSNQLSISQANFIPVIAIPSTINPGKIEIKRIFSQQQLEVPTADQGTISESSLDNTKAILQNTILMRNQTDFPGASIQSSELHSSTVFQPTPSLDSSQSSSPPLVNFPQPTDQNTLSGAQPTSVPSDLFAPTKSGSSDQQENALSKEDDKLSPHSQGNDLMEFLYRHIKEESANQQDPVLVSDSSAAQTSFGEPSFGQDRRSLQIETPDDSCFETKTHPSDMAQVHLSSQPVYQDHPTRSSTSTCIASHSGATPAQITHSSDHSTIPFAAYTSSHFSSALSTQDRYPPGFQLGGANMTNFPGQSSFTGQQSYQDYPPTTVNISYDSHQDLMFQNPSTFTPQPNQLQQHQHHHQQMYPSSFNSEGHFTQAPSTYHTASSPPSLPAGQFNSNFDYNLTQPHQFPSSQDFVPRADFANAQQLHSMPRQHEIPSINTLNVAGPSTSGTSLRGRGLTVNCQNPATSSDENSDLIALLSKQLSKSQVADIFPPTLALTPRGTGAGYGVGMDLDTMLTDAQDNTASVRLEQSPLSSSLLADWLDISGNISVADLEALERELALQSPMYVSFNDVN